MIDATWPSVRLSSAPRRQLLLSPYSSIWRWTVSLTCPPGQIEHGVRPRRRLGIDPERCSEGRNLAVMPANQHDLARVLRVREDVAGHRGVLVVGMRIVEVIVAQPER